MKTWHWVALAVVVVVVCMHVHKTMNTTNAIPTNTAA